MELIAIAIIVAGGIILAVLVLAAFAIGRAAAQEKSAAPSGLREIAASLLYGVLTAGGGSRTDALRRLRRETSFASPPTSPIDMVSWGEAFARRAQERQREELLETAVRLLSAEDKPIPLLQYCALLDLSFALGFQTDALARLRERYGFEYVDHAKNARPQEADRSGGAAPLFVREEKDPSKFLHVLQIEGTPSRPAIIRAYRRLAAQNHPDRFHDQSQEARERAAARFIEITRAYEHLLAIYRD